MPAYNEEQTIATVIDRVNRIDLPRGISKELIIVDDGSSDKTARVIQGYINANRKYKISYYSHENNQGKGAAIHTALKHVTGDYVIIQDADLEYDPSEYSHLLGPLLDGFADVVYGSRFRGNNPHRILFFWHSIGNFFLTFLSNICTNLNLSDMETCYKIFRTDLIKSVDLKERGFGFEPEVTAKISRIKSVRIYEVGISYYGRTYDEGKKVNWRDGFRAMYCIFKYGLLKIN